MLPLDGVDISPDQAQLPLGLIEESLRTWKLSDNDLTRFCSKTLGKEA